MALDDLLSGISGIGNTIYNLWANKRDFDYQKNLQKTLFDREDTAVQRRMEDLKAAGINPNLAAGSAAGAGSVVSRSNTNDVNFGSVLDTLMAKKQLTTQSLNNEILKHEKNKAFWDSRSSFEDLRLKGFERQLHEDWFSYLYGDQDRIKSMKINNPKLYQYLEYQFSNDKNSSEMLQKQNNWFTTNQIINGLGSLAKDVSYFTPSFVKHMK